ncbi:MULTISPECIES: protein translocase subunit SecF [Caulobacter]|jgi:preprotein translocase subunit SecF|uniref:Protein-export membrane protein SecF n=1 Tax=Caulobacter vibrioides OR37 TaxID=1292034 RepID=R0EH08_CAUVI|nr:MULTISPECIES: protein translocase subunit SecF [Caulobacter]ENZ80537.1 protein translocase subunit secF [Caulobacter vibrioides OR37]MBQ1560449.1 protein translocase subunit SecF [Caulobacter sp.]
MRWPLIRYIPRSTHFRFVRWAPVAAVVSAVLIVASIALLFLQGLNLGIDFKGGNALEITMSRPAPLGELRAAMGQIGAHDAQVQGFGSPNSAMVKFLPNKGEKASDASARVEGELIKRFPDLKVKSRSEVGAKVSGELLMSGFKALGVALLLTLGYIWFRFGLSYGTGAVVAVLHDIVLTLGLLSVARIEFSMTEIAALLTVIGYSMNEKVITFDRLKENLRKYRTTPLRDVIDLSENERLSRTIITGTTALLALGGTMAFGGPVLYPLVFTMIFGIVIGTYSSVYIALPMILIWGVKRNDEEATPVKFGAASRP